MTDTPPATAGTHSKAAETKDTHSRRPPVWALALAAVAALAVVLLVVSRLILSSLSSPAALVERLETNYNLRAEIGGSSVSLFGSGPNISLRNVKIGPRDHLADNAVPLASRPPMQNALVEVETADLDVNLAALWKGQLDIRDLSLGALRASPVRDQDNAWNTTDLTRAPSVVAGSPRTTKTDDATPPPADDDPTPPAATDEPPILAAADEGLTAIGLPFAARADRLAIERSAIDVLLQRRDTHVRIDGLDLFIHDLDVDPANLSVANTATLAVGGLVSVTRPERNIDYADFQISGGGPVQPFDPETGLLNPSGDLVITLGDPSTINILPTLEKLTRRAEGLRRFGLDIVDELSSTLSFTPGTEMRLRLENGRLTLTQPLPATVNRLTLTLQPGSWYEPDGNEHSFRATLEATDTLSSRLRQSIVEQSTRFPGNSGAIIREELEKSFFVDGEFQPVILSTGDLGDPDVELENELPDLGRILGGLLGEIGIDEESLDNLRESGRELLRGLRRNRDRD